MRSFSSPTDALKCLKEAQQYFDGFPASSECPLLKGWFNVADDGGQERITNYSRSVVPQRIIQLTTFAFAKSYHFVSGYLAGVQIKNPFCLFTMARCQAELLASVYRPISIIRASSTKTPTAEQLAVVDRALVRFLYGNRAEQFELFHENCVDFAEVPQTANEDWTAINIITLIDKLNKDNEYHGIKQDYERLCEYVHPNLLSNFVLTEPFVKGEKANVRIHRKGEYLMTRCLRETAQRMAAWTDATIRLINSIDWPFGEPLWKDAC